MSTSTAQSLYSRDVLRLATSLPHDDRIAGTHESATRRAIVCGSEMSVDVAIQDGKIAAIAIRARACAIGQASAAILHGMAVGRTEAEIVRLFQRVEAALKGEAEMPSEYAVLAYAREYPARHAAIQLPFETLLAALEQAAA